MDRSSFARMATARDDDFFIAIPSYEREKDIGHKTLALMTRHCISPQQVYIFVASSEQEERYRKELGSQWPNIVVGVPTLWRQRNFIMDYFEEGSHVVSLDDDVEDFFRMRGDPKNNDAKLEVLHAGGFKDIIQNARVRMHSLGLFLWSLNVSDNPYFMKVAKVTLRNGLCNGFIWGCLVRKAPELCLRHGDGHEDIERTLRYLDADGQVFRYREFCAKTRCKTNKGGLQSSMSQAKRKEEEDNSIKLLVKEFPWYLMSLPGAKLGSKFINGSGYCSQFSVLNAAAFRRCVARKQLSSLVTGLCVVIGARNCFHPCRVHVARQDLGMIGLKTDKGQRLLTGTWEFHDAMGRGKLFVLWLPEESCVALDITSSGSLSDLPECFRYHDEGGMNTDTNVVPSFQDGPSCARPEVSTAAKPCVVSSPSAAELSEFGRYLATFDCDDADSSEDEDHTACLAGKEEAQTIGTRRQANVCRKTASKMEDADWIASQMEDVDALAKASDADPSEPRTEIDIVIAWAIHTDFETGLSKKHAERSSSSQAAQHGSRDDKVNALFCASRIWAGGWGAQCTHPKVEGDELCTTHRKEVQRQGYLTHGRISGPPPPKKQKEFEKWQKILFARAAATTTSASSTSQPMPDSQAWKAMDRAPSESALAYEYRTGNRAECTEPVKKTRKRPAPSAEPSPQVSEKSRKQVESSSKAFGKAPKQELKKETSAKVCKRHAGASAVKPTGTRGN